MYMLLTYNQIDIYPAGYPSSLERTSIHTNQRTMGFSIHTSSIYKARKNIIYTSIQFAECK